MSSMQDHTDDPDVHEAHTEKHEVSDARTEKRNAHKPRADARAPMAATVAQLSEFDEIIDVRSQSEYAEDHIPGAVNCPVLDDAERVEVGTLYKHSSFDAKKIGAALVSANIARHLRQRFQDKPRTWRPLVYCWRGGGRSGALAHVMMQVGWRVGRLDGGYRAYRRAVIEDLAALPQRLQWRVVCGMTGTGKSRLLRELARAGCQVLDLEALALHRGSVLGNVPGERQPSQKMFESLVWSELQQFSPRRPIFVEAESKKIGGLRVPEALIAAMWASPCLVLEAPIAARIALLKQEYAHFLNEPALLATQLDCLTGVHGRVTVERWQTAARARRWDELVGELLVQHYDPAYTRSTLKHYPQLADAPRLVLDDASDGAFARLAAACREAVQPA
jgi:tRNA 2-selenouridine synthase